jgi:hypothetical protein
MAVAVVNSLCCISSVMLVVASMVVTFCGVYDRPDGNGDASGRSHSSDVVLAVSAVVLASFAVTLVVSLRTATCAWRGLPWTCHVLAAIVCCGIGYGLFALVRT